MSSFTFCTDVADISNDSLQHAVSVGQARLEDLKLAVALEVFAHKEFQQKRALLAWSSGFQLT